MPPLRSDSSRSLCVTPPPLPLPPPPPLHHREGPGFRRVLPDLPRLQRFGTTGVVLAAQQLSVPLGDEEQAVAVLVAVGTGTHLVVLRVDSRDGDR
uniref:Uncharacterized protein n=1 Tax=Dicentrarchus labrax TaxID=13489 RepID=A0A8P4K0L6_DICLA